MSEMTGHSIAKIAYSPAARAVGIMLIRDALTGLYNRTYLCRRLVHEFARNRRVTLLLMDLNGFKRVNDTVGHAAGDELLRTVAAHMTDSLPPEGIAVRYGGDEFVLLLPAWGGRRAQEFAEEMLDGLGRLGGTQHFAGVSGSIGIATWPDDAMNGDELIRCADQAMYYAKATKMEVCLYLRLQHLPGLESGAIEEPPDLGPSDLSGTVTLLCAMVGGHCQPNDEGLHRLLNLFRDHVTRQGGVMHGQMDLTGEWCAVFTSVRRAMHTARILQHVHSAHANEPYFRFALTLGNPSGRHSGLSVHRCRALVRAATADQILLTRALADSSASSLPIGTRLVQLGMHRLTDLGEPEAVYSLEELGHTTPVTPLCTLDTLPTNLPSNLAVFVGRDREMADVGQLMREARLLTIVGGPGIGKTRLALHVGAAHLNEFPEGVWVVDLDGIPRTLSLPHLIGEVLSVPSNSGEAKLSPLSQHLSEKRLLLILDGCGQSIDAIRALVPSLLAQCPDLRILATNRVPIALPGEAVYSLAGLALPSHPSDRRDSESLQLFVDRAKSVLPQFLLTARNAEPVTSLCRSLDGVPLAVEMAAAQMQGIAPDRLAEVLSDFMDQVAASIEYAMPEYSFYGISLALSLCYRLISEEERLLWRRLSVFRGGFTLDAAEHVCSCSVLAESQVINALSELVGKAIIARVEGEVTHYRLPESVREFGEERLRESREEEAYRLRHLQWYGRRDHQEGARGEWFNLHAALEWSLARPEHASVGLRILAALQESWNGVEPWDVVRRRLEGAL